MQKWYVINACTYSHNYLLPFVLIGQPASTQLRNRSLCWSANTSVSMCRSPSLKSSFLLFFNSAQHCLAWIVCEGAASRISSKQHPVSLYNLIKLFSSGVSLDTMWYTHTVVQTRLQLRRISVSFYQRSDFYMVVYLSVAVHALHIRML